MSASGATIQRQGIHLPIWPILALVVIAVATGITLRVMDDVRPAAPATAAQDSYVSWQSTVQDAASSLQGVRPTMVGVIGVSAYEASAAAIRELPATPFHADGRAHEVDFGTTVTAPAAPAQVEDFRDCLGCGGRR